MRDNRGTVAEATSAEICANISSRCNARLKREEGNAGCQKLRRKPVQKGLTRAKVTGVRQRFFEYEQLIT